MKSNHPQIPNSRIPRPIFNVRDVNLGCPVRNCPSFFVKKDLLQHFNTAHAAGKPMEVFEKQNIRFKLRLEPDDCELDEVHLIGVLAYKGTREGSLPAERNLCVPNEGFHKHPILRGSLPIVLVGSWAMVPEAVDVKAKNDKQKKTEKRGEKKSEQQQQQQQKCFLIWGLTGPSNTRFLCTITAIGDRLTSSRYMVTMTRRLHLDSQIAHEIPLNETNTFLSLNQTEVAKLTANYNEMLTIEVSVKEQRLEHFVG